MLYGVNPKARYFGLRNVTGTAVASAAGSTATLATKNNSGGDFYITRMKFRATFNTAQSSGIAGTPLLESASPTVGSNTMPSLDTVTVNIKIGPDNFFNQQVSLGALRDQDGWFRLDNVIPKVGSNQDIQVDITNNSGFTIYVEPFFDGFMVPAGDPGLVQAA
jgi:hypothetical protein